MKDYLGKRNWGSRSDELISFYTSPESIDRHGGVSRMYEGPEWGPKRLVTLSAPPLALYRQNDDGCSQRNGAPCCFSTFTSLNSSRLIQSFMTNLQPLLIYRNRVGKQSFLIDVTTDIQSSLFLINHVSHRTTYSPASFIRREVRPVHPRAS